MSSSRFHVVTVEIPEARDDMRIWLDGMPLKGIRSFEIRSSVGDVTEVSFTIIAAIGDVPNKVKP